MNEPSSTAYRIDEIDRIWRPDGDFAIKRILEYGSNQTATNVVSEDGSVLYTFPGSLDKIIRMCGKLYAVTVDYTCETNVTTFYEIDPTSSSVKAVRTSEVKISLRAVRRSENVTIETGSTDSKVGREVVVTSADGRVIERRSIFPRALPVRKSTRPAWRAACITSRCTPTASVWTMVRLL